MTHSFDGVLNAAWLGLKPYSAMLELQHTLLDERKAGNIPDTVLLLEHPNVFTLGRRGKPEDIYADNEWLQEKGCDVVETDRGGETTYHGPGQLVAYPVISIREAEMGPVAYVRMLEEAVIRTLAEYSVQAHRVVGKTGVWVGGEPGCKPSNDELPTGRKIAAIGVRVSGGVAMHGMALNVATDLSFYNCISPCGMPGLQTTSIERETGMSLSARVVGEVWSRVFAQILMRRIKWSDIDVLMALRSDEASLSV